jgi:hypothetical protein
MNKYKEFLGRNRRLLPILILVVLLPAIVASVYFINKRQSRAAVATPTNIQTKRLTTVVGQVCFDTDIEIESSIDCSIGLQGTKFFCGKDDAPKTHRCFKTDDFNINLNPGTGYYVFINTGREQPSLAYIPASPDDPKFSLQLESYEEDHLWLCRGEQGFDPALDINQDGCVNLSDMAEFYTE